MKRMSAIIRRCCQILTLVLALIIFQGLGTEIFGQTAADQAKPFFEKHNVWNFMEDGYMAIHVYGLVLTKKGTILAFSEGRYGQYDGDPSNIIVKRGTNNGVTWSDDTLIEQSNGKFYESEGTEGRREAWANPAALVDQKTGRVFIFYVLNEGSHEQRSTRVFYRYSDDDGETWQPSAKKGGRIEITDLLKNNKNNWTFFMSGPGHGIQLAQQKGANAGKNGRLIMQFWNRRAVSERPRNYGVVAVYSDNDGKTWRRGGEAGMDYGMNESRLLEFSDGRILLNARGSDAEDNSQKTDTKKSRLFSYSRDGGESFSPPELRPELKYTNIDSGMAGYTDPDGRECVLFSHPDDLNARIKMTVNLSCDGLKTWSVNRLVDEGKSIYSDLLVFPDKTIGLLYGVRRAQEPYEIGVATGVMFARFNYPWLTGK